MYLKEIRTYGFKSFADKTVIEFGKNINGIVGPNGSGKSNIVDAVRWVLGEQSMKSLRGDISTDVIFSGSDTRKPLNSSSVTLVFNNEDRKLPIDLSEVSIKRMAFRTGENEYYINNEKVRLKDITDLLTDSGTAKESFNIISQGKIDEILSNKPEDRRVIFEEASGVLKYKKRKEEAFRKLDKTNQNLNRVNDIISELSSTITPLEISSQKAQKYTSIKNKLSNIEIGVLAKNIFDLNFEYQNNKKKIASLENEISELNVGNSNYDIAILKEREKLQKTREDINTKQSKLLELTKEEEKITADIKLFEERNKYRKNKDLVANSILKIKEELLTIKAKIDALNSDTEITKKRQEIISRNIDSIKEKRNICVEKRTTLNNEVIKNNRDINTLKYKIEYLEDSLNNNSIFPKPIKAILDNPKFTGIHGTISSLITSPSEYSNAINISLATSSSYLVVDTPSIAKELIYYLKNNNLGRATFYPLSVITGRYINSNELEILREEKGFIDVASNLVTYDSKYQNIITNVLGNVIVADNIDNANHISAKINKKYRIVTLDGQVINVGGSLTGGSITKTTTPVSVKYELDENKRNLDLLESENTSKLKEIESLNKEISSFDENLFQNQNELAKCESSIRSIETDIRNNREEYDIKEKELNDLTIITNTDNSENIYLDKLTKVREEISNLNKEISISKVLEDNANSTIKELEESSKTSSGYISKKEKELNNLNIEVNRADVKLDNLLNELNNTYNITYEFAIENYKLDIDIDTAEREVNKLKEELSLLGNVNLDAPSEYEKAKSRYDFLNKQKEDLISAENTLYDIIKEMDSIMKKKLEETFEEVRKEFKIVYRELFKGGKAELLLTNPDNILETGIEIKAEPPGKKLQNINLLSGGEKTFTAISLLFAILNVRPVPFCLFDEVEAALDDANVEAFGKYLDKYRNNTQFIIITHKKKTMEYADILYGVTMEESGVSKIVSVKLEDIEKN